MGRCSPGSRSPTSASRIADYGDGDVANSDHYDEYIDWFFDRGERLRAAIASVVADVRRVSERIYRDRNLQHSGLPGALIVQRDLSELENRLWDAADELRANSKLKASEYGTPVLGLIFLRFADASSTRRASESRRRRRRAGRSARRDYQAERVIYLPDAARFAHLLELPEGADLGKAVNEAMRPIEEQNPELAGVLPRTYTQLENSTLASLLRHINSYTKDLEGDAFGLIYEYFLAKFAIAEGQARRRVLHADVDRAADRRDHRAVPRPHLRPGLRLGRHVRPVARSSSSDHRRLAGARAVGLRPGADGGDGAARRR